MTTRPALTDLAVLRAAASDFQGALHLSLDDEDTWTVSTPVDPVAQGAGAERSPAEQGFLMAAFVPDDGRDWVCLSQGVLLVFRDAGIPSSLL